MQHSSPLVIRRARLGGFLCSAIVALGCSGSAGSSGHTDVAGGDTGSASTGEAGSEASDGNATAGNTTTTVTDGDSTSSTSTGDANVDDPMGANTDTDVDDPDELAPTYIEARIRRLTNTEYDRTVGDLLGTSQRFEENLVSNSRQQGFTLNALQIVDPVLATQLQEAATVLADEVVTERLTELAPCAATSPGADCATEFFESFLPRAYRRPLTDADLARAQSLYELGAEQNFEQGIRLVIQAVLQSASFLYHTELGDPAAAAGSTTTLTEHELAAALSYIITQSPPDEELRTAVDAGSLTDPDVREAQARRLLDSTLAEDQVARFVTEWVGVDQIIETGKDPEEFAGVDFDTLRHSMLNETKDFTKEVVFRRTGGLAELLTADFTLVSDDLAAFYGISAGAGATSLSDTPRRGLLNQASFLATYASELDSAPVRRGALVMRHLTCVDPGDPNLLNIEVVPPPPDPNASTRQLFSDHTQDPECRGCHTRIDPIGFSFENYDAVGQERSTDNGHDVDTSGAFELTMTDLGTTAFADSAEMANLLAQSEDVKRCFARHLFRFASAQSDRATEETFLREWALLDANSRDKLLELFIAFARSDLFSLRGVQ